MSDEVLRLKSVVANLTKELDNKFKSVIILESELAKKKRSVHYLMSLLEKEDEPSEESE